MIDLRWLQSDLSRVDPDAERHRRELVGASTILDVLATIILKEIASIDNPSTDDYNNPNWAYRQADRIGQRRMAERLLSLTHRK